MKKENISTSFPILEEAEKRLERLNQLHFVSSDKEFLERFILEFRILILKNHKLKKQLELFQILEKKK